MLSTSAMSTDVINKTFRFFWHFNFFRNVWCFLFKFIKIISYVYNEIYYRQISVFFGISGSTIHFTVNKWREEETIITTFWWQQTQNLYPSRRSNFSKFCGKQTFYNGYWSDCPQLLLPCEEKQNSDVYIRILENITLASVGRTFPNN